MSDDRFFERLRDAAGPLRYEPDDVAFTRLQARVRDRIRTPQTVAQLLAGWFRPVAVSIAVLTLVTALGSAWYQQNHEMSTTASLDAMATTSSSVDVSVDGDTFSVAD